MRRNGSLRRRTEERDPRNPRQQAQPGEAPDVAAGQCQEPAHGKRAEGGIEASDRHDAASIGPDFGKRGLSRDLGKPVRATADWQSCLEGADILVEASRLERPTPLFLTRWVKPGALVVPYGTMSAVELDLTDIMDKLVVDDWGQCKGGKLGALRAHVEAGKLSAATLHAELCQIVVGARPGRERDDETILFWHRGLSLSDIALGHAMLEKAAAKGLGQRLRFA